ncbi:MAG: methyltransferase [Microbacteriaceae bacterium]|nr:methyltransferase [Microbacteriaceae bacterium]
MLREHRPMPLNGTVTDTELILRLRDDLQSLRFSVESVNALWGDDATAALRRGHRVPALRALAATTATSTDASVSGASVRETPDAAELATVARFAMLSLPVTRAAFNAAFPRLGADGAIALGLAAVIPATHADATGPAVPADQGSLADPTETLRPLLDLRPHSFVDSRGVGTWWILSDLGELALGTALPEGHVLGVGGASVTLSGLMIQRQVDLALDLGTGCGIQALHAARHARRVVATDISPRALWLAELNAVLNGIDNIEFRLGSLFEPVGGERFDHIVSNPPFVITPRASGVPNFDYRDGGLVGDEIVEAVVRGAAEHLTVGGIMQLLGNWEYRGGGDAFSRVAAWLDAPADGLDAWIIERELQHPTLYAETWIRDGGTVPGPRFDALTTAWLDDFDSRKVRAVGFGYLTLRRTSGTEPFRRFERLTGHAGHNPAGRGEHLAATLAAHDWQNSHTDDALLKAFLEVAPDVTEERHYWPGAEDPTVMTLHQGGGFARSRALDTALAAFIGACDGDLSAESIIGAVAQLLRVDEAALRAELTPSIRELIVTGFLTGG